MKADPQRVARVYLAAMEGQRVLAELDALKVAPQSKTAGEVRFIKDRSGDASEWAWNTPPVSQREITEDYVFNAKALEPLSRVLRSLLSALGFAMSGYTTFTKTKSMTLSPDGALGGKGYIMKIADMRRQLMNCIEVLSAVTDSIYDEVQAPHWKPESEGLGNRARPEVEEILQDVEEIKKDPEEWANEEEEKADAENESAGMTQMKTANRLALRYMGDLV